MAKKSIVLIVGIIMIIILIILAIILSGCLFKNKYVTSVSDYSLKSTFYFKTFSINSYFGDKNQRSYTEGECCNKNTFTNYNFQEKVEEKENYVDNLFYKPTCCNDQKVYTSHHLKKERITPKTGENNFHVAGCSY